MEVATLVGGLIHSHGVAYAESEPGGRAIRHECYVWLGGNGIKVTDEVRSRVADLVKRTLAVYRWL